jgi:tetratricopeptide (TPR) repeat protein
MEYKEIFDRYLDGRLSGEELKEFEKSLREDPEIAGELDQYKILQSTSEKLISDESADQQAKDDIADFKQKDVSRDIDLQNFKQALDRAGSKQMSPLWYVAAVALVGAITIAFILLINGQTGMPDMYAKYYEPYHQSEKIFEITRSNDDLYFAVQLFESGDYSRAFLLFNQLADSSGFTPYSYFYSGLIYIHQEKWEMAIEAFNLAIAVGDSDILSDARWYLGLCYLRVGNASAAREQFEFLSETKNEYSNRARKIIRHLD